MSLIAVIAFKTGEIGIWGDTVVTSNQLPAHFPIVGKTSQGETIQPLSTPSGVEYYYEGACKVGVFGNKTIVGIATGDVNFAIQFLAFIERVLADANSLNDIREAVNRTCEIMSIPDTTEPSTTQISIVTEINNRKYYLPLTITRNANGECTAKLPVKEVIPGEEWADLLGSGKERLTDIERSGLKYAAEYLSRNINNSKHLPFCVANQLSSWVRNEYYNQAPGFGGVFLGYLHSNQGIVGTPDAIHIQANPSREITVFYKIISRERTLFVHDLIARKLSRFETLEGFIHRARGGSNMMNREQNNREALRLNAKFASYDFRTPDHPEQPMFTINYIADDVDVLKLSGDIPDATIPLYPEPGGDLHFEMHDGRNFTVKMPL